MCWMERYKKLLDKQGVKYIQFDNLLLREYNQIIIPLGPIVIDKPKLEVDRKALFRKLKGKLAWWSYYSDDMSTDGWYGVIKTSHIQIEEYRNSNLRRKIRKGLKEFKIEKITAQVLSEKGQEVYTTVEKAYGNKPKVEKFIGQLGSYVDFSDIVDLWGVFYKEKLIGYTIVYNYDKEEANISEIKILNDYKKYYPSYALFHKLSEFYIQNNSFNSISDGYRTLLHDSGVQEFLIKNFGFKKVGLEIELLIKQPWCHILYDMYPLRNLIPVNSLRAVFSLMFIYKQQKRLP